MVDVRKDLDDTKVHAYWPMYAYSRPSQNVPLTLSQYVLSMGRSRKLDSLGCGERGSDWNANSIKFISREDPQVVTGPV